MDDQIADTIKVKLANTPYNVTHLERVSGGNANFTYRGILSNGNTVFIKHAEPFAALSPSHALDASRSDYEWTMLQALSNRPAVVTKPFQVRTPKVFGSFDTTKIVEDMPKSLTIKAYLSQYGASISQEIALVLGKALGNWLARFHQWLNGNETTALREKLKNNPLIGARANLYIGSYWECTQMFPQLVWPDAEKFAAIEKHVRDLYDQGDEAIHGDFWTGNMILKDEPLPSKDATNSVDDIFILDFEVSQHGSRAQDIAQCLGELWMVYHFYGAQAPFEVMRGVVDAYFAANTDIPIKDLALQIAIHFGVHIVVIPSRYGWPKGEKLEECVKFGNDCLVHGYEADAEWFKNTSLQFLFDV